MMYEFLHTALTDDMKKLFEVAWNDGGIKIVDEKQLIPRFIPLPQPERVDVHGKATVVHWKDGSYTSVVATDQDENNVYAAFCAALCKKIYGSTSAVHKLVDSRLGTEIDRKEEEARREHKRMQDEREERNRQREINRIMKQMGLEREALRRLGVQEDE